METSFLAHDQVTKAKCELTHTKATAENQMETFFSQ